MAARLLAGVEIAYSDVDGTILGRGGSLLLDIDGNPTLAAARAVLDVNAAGLPCVLVSGRTAPMLREITRILGWQDFIAEMGTIRAYGRGEHVVYDLGQWTEGVIPADMTPYDAIEEAGAIQALFDAFPGKIEYHSPHHVGRETSHLLRGAVDPGAAQAILDAMTLPVAFHDNGIIHPPAHTLVGVEKVHAYHVMPKGVTKADAVGRDLESRALRPEQAVMIGDSLADVEVADRVGLVVLTANALRSDGVAEAAARAGNVVVTAGASGVGWAEFAAAWLDARGNPAF